MDDQFHTPSFGDEVFAVPDLDSNTSANFEHHHHQQQHHSKRMRGSMDSSQDEYHSANDDSFLVSPTSTATATVAARKQLVPSTDLNEPIEPAKPLSAYALFFRDTVSVIKQQNPNCTFQEISRIVASMWEALDPTHKNLYNKKNENAKNTYIKNMRNYRQHQLEQQQLKHANPSSHPMQSKPAVFTIPRTSSESDLQTFNSSTTNNQQDMNSPQQPIQAQYHQQETQQQMQAQYQQQDPQQQLQAQYQQQEPQQQMHQYQQQFEAQHPDFNHQQQQQSVAIYIDSQPAQQIQLLTEAGSVQKCIRELCTKRAIINPDWEDEYCSNECVVVHCRNVFNSWVQANLDARTQ